MDNYIFKKRKVLTREECQNIIDLFENTTVMGGETDQKRIEWGDEYVKRQYWCVGGDLRMEKYWGLERKLLENHILYTRKHPFLGSKVLQLDRYFNIQKFKPGDAYSTEHCEHGPGTFNDAIRVGVWMFYLNDIRNKGGTRWPQQNFTSKPRAGDLYIWPAGWTHSHHGISAPRETKYILTGWTKYLTIDHSLTREEQEFSKPIK